MMEASVCLSGTRVSEVSLDQNAAPVDPVALSRGQKRPSMRHQEPHDDAPTLQGESTQASARREPEANCTRTSR